MPSWGGAAKGAATGAAIGSVVPVVGTALGAGLGALTGGLFGKKKAAPAAAAPTGQVMAQALSPEAKALTDQSASSRRRADELGGAGDEALALATDFFRRMTGGDPTATNPQVGMVIDQYDTARKNIAEFGGRGGGTTSVSAQSRVDQAHQIADVRSTGMTTGAQALAAIGQTEQGLALSADQLASMDLNAVMQHALGEKSLALGEKQLAEQHSANRANTTSQLAQGIGYILGLYLTRGGSHKAA